MLDEKIIQKFRFKKIAKMRHYFNEEIKQNNLMS